MDRTDEELVNDTRAEIEGSFDQLVYKYTTPLYNFAHRLTGHTEYAEDITQETFIKVWKNLKRYDARYSFKSWIFTIARNTATDFLRKRKSILFSSLDTPDNIPYEATIEDETELPLESLMKLEENDALTETLKQLPLDYQTVLILHYQNDMTFEEISKTMGKPLNTVKSWHRRALVKLRELVDNCT